MAGIVLQSAVGMPGMEVPDKFIYEAYRKVGDLPPTAKFFYNALSEYFKYAHLRYHLLPEYNTNQSMYRLRS